MIDDRSRDWIREFGRLNPVRERRERISRSETKRPAGRTKRIGAGRRVKETDGNEARADLGARLPERSGGMGPPRSELGDGVRRGEAPRLAMPGVGQTRAPTVGAPAGAERAHGAPRATGDGVRAGEAPV